MTDPGNPYAAPQSQPAEVFPQLRAAESAHSPRISAGFGSRFLALVLDVIISGICAYICGTVIFTFHRLAGGYLEDAPMAEVITFGIVGWLYFGLQDSSAAQATVGKRVMGIRITNTKGERIGFFRASIRHFAKALSALMILTGYFMMLWTPKQQTLHDLLSGCLVSEKDKGTGRRFGS